ncbi:unnamed protein product [Paramecium sonneborni]|uniref:Oxidoreductase-like domain-containing protein n=1 Tax=Paramecium sonneborni TaxID=65129 RepID=A0A8S1QAP5_9CILI|nr:unnamed protein product [Paramecium sonneborni]
MLLIYIRQIRRNQWSQIASQLKQNIKLFDRIDESNLCKEQKRPIEPEQKGPEEFCGSGCQRFVLDFYYEELEQYEKDLIEWVTELDENEEKNEQS